MLFLTSYLCHKGKIRENNEDAVLIMDSFIRDNQGEISLMYDNKGFFLAVADGMGGANSGEIASEITLKTIKNSSPDNTDELIKSLRKSKENIKEFVKNHHENTGTGTAVAGIYIKENNGIVFNVGDCRVYKKRGGFLMRISRDHSVVENLLEQGLIAPEEMRKHPKRNVITSAISSDGDIDDFEIYTRNIKIQDGDVFLICSDGLWDMLEDEEMESCMQVSGVVRCLFDKAMENGGKDNISIILVEAKDE